MVKLTAVTKGTTKTAVAAEAALPLMAGGSGRTGARSSSAKLSELQAASKSFQDATAVQTRIAS